MANELNAAIGQSGLTVTAQLYTAGVASGAAISCPEIGTSGIYTGTMAGAAATYQVAFLASSVIRASGQIIWDGSAEVTENSVMTRIGAAGAGLTNIGTIATVTNLTNLPATAALEATLTAMKGATFSGATDSLEALRDRGDAAWITATGFATPTNITAASGVSLAASQHVIVDSGTITTYTGNTPQTGDVATLITTVGVAGAGLTAVGITSNIKKNQALAGFEFLMTDSTNHAPSTGLAVSVTRSIDGGAFAAGTLSAVTEVANGIYSVDFGAGDLNGKVITLKATAAASDTTFERIVTQA